MYKKFVLYYLFALILAVSLAVDEAERNWSVSISHNVSVTAVLGGDLSVKCRLHLEQNKILNSTLAAPPFSGLTWHSSHPDDSHIEQEWLSEYTLELRIASVRSADAGMYWCDSSLRGVQPAHFRLHVDASARGVARPGCTGLQFRCVNDHLCIPERYRCDRVPDCLDGSDEWQCREICLVSEFECDNGQCVPRERVCDLYAGYDCRDRSDERDCPDSVPYGEPVSTTMAWQSVSVPEHHPHGFHFHAIYSTLAILLAVLLLVLLLIFTMRRVSQQRHRAATAMSHREIQGRLRRDGPDGREDVEIYFYSVLERHNSATAATPGSSWLPWRWRAPLLATVEPGPADNTSAGTQQRLVSSERLLPLRGPSSAPVLCPRRSGYIMLNLGPGAVPQLMPKPPAYEEVEPPVPRAGTPPPAYSTLERGAAETRVSQGVDETSVIADGAGTTGSSEN